jgi:hypothetical protein
LSRSRTLWLDDRRMHQKPAAERATLVEGFERERPAAGPKQRTFKVTLTALGFSLLLTICRVRRLTSAARALSLLPVRALNVANQVNQGSRLIAISTTHANFSSPTWQTEARCEVKARRTIGAECIMDDTGNSR